jgi:hypothetical protein
MDGKCENVVSFSSATISKGLIEYCKRFDYESLQPSKISDKKNYYSWLNKVLQMKKPYFTLDEVCKVFSIKPPVAVKYVTDMEKMGIITPDIACDDVKNKAYKTVDPRICFLMARGVTSLS